MYKIILFSLIFLFSKMYTQEIIWEKNSKTEIVQTVSKNSIVLDSDDNIISLLEGDYNYQFFSILQKYSNEGDLLQTKELYSPFQTGKTVFKIGLALNQQNGKVNIFYGIINKPFLVENENLLPMVQLVDKNLDTSLGIYNYNINESSNYLNYGFYKDNFIQNILSENNMYFNAYIKAYIKISDNVTQKKYHLLLGCYDSTGKFLWRNGFDTLGLGQILTLRDMKLSNSKTLLILCYKSNIPTDISPLQLLEFDLNGKMKNNLNLEKIEQNFDTKQVVKLDDGNYIFLNQYLDKKNYEHFLCLVNPNGTIIKRILVPKKNSNSDYTQMILSNDGNIFLLGNQIMDNKGTTDPYDDIVRQFILKISNNLEFIWEYNTENFPFPDFKFKNIINLKNNEFLVTGSKNSNDFYIAKFKDLKYNGIDSSIYNNTITFNNPVNDFLTIEGIKDKNVQIYDMLGNMVLNTEYSNKIDISKFVGGVYLLKVNNNFFKFIKCQ